MEELKTNEYLRGIVMNLPTSPGIYQYLNAEGTIIYVGKAKNLKRRVYSYFSREHQSAKTRILVSKIADIRYIVVNTEEDALLLENNLIKKYKPRYNVLLKDDKSYPSICVSNEYFPRVFKTRKIVRDGSTYFGPYTHFPSMQAMLDLIKKLYPLRTCHLVLTPENIQANKFRVCLEYHIKNCKGPCIGAQSHEEYMANIASIKELLKGNTQKVSKKPNSSKRNTNSSKATGQRAKWSVRCCTTSMYSPSKTMNSRPTSTTFISPMVASTRPSRSNTRSEWKRRKKNCWKWAS